MVSKMIPSPVACGEAASNRAKGPLEEIARYETTRLIDQPTSRILRPLTESRRRAGSPVWKRSEGWMRRGKVHARDSVAAYRYDQVSITSLVCPFSRKLTRSLPEKSRKFTRYKNKLIYFARSKGVGWGFTISEEDSSHVVDVGNAELSVRFPDARRGGDVVTANIRGRQILRGG